MHCTRCISALLALAVALPAAAQEPMAEPRSVPATFGTPKSVATARVLGIVPGAGHVYAGETRRAIGFVGSMAGVLALGTLSFAEDCLADVLVEPVDCGFRTADVTVIAFYGLWAWSIYDAGRAAQRTNARRGFTVLPTVAPTLLAGTGGGKKLGIRAGLGLVTR